MNEMDKELYDLCINKDKNTTWNDIAIEMNSLFDCKLGPDAYRKRWHKLSSEVYSSEDEEEVVESVENNTDETEDKLLELKKERMKLTDVKTQINADIRRMSREETLKEIAKEAVKTIDSDFKLIPERKRSIWRDDSNSAILEISDWHYGIDIDNFWNVYSPEIAKERISRLRDEVIEIIIKEDVNELHIVNLGDLIAGRIHLPLRLNSRLDTVTQTIQVTELLAELIASLSGYVDRTYYYSTSDNHSRVEPIKDNSMDLESFARFTDWFLKERLKDFDNVIFEDNMYSDEIVTFNVFDYNVVAVHGDRDKPSKVIDNMTMMTHKHFDLALTAHLHHFSAEEKNETLLISNGSLMGTDDYAEKLRLSSKPSQNMLIVSEDNVMKCLYRIVLDN